MSSPHRASLIAISVVLALASAASAQAPPTVWHALGIPQGWGRFRDATANRWGNHPNLEKKPPLKGLADPANLKSDVPAIKAAAEIKAQQDLAPQKIKAIKYLGQIGCGCYGGVAEALMAALEDCTEVVRLAAAEALSEALACKCDVCEATCCTPELAAKMYERAYGRDANGCYLEPSERVRAALEQAVAACPPTDGGEGSIVVPQTDDTRGEPAPPVVPNIEDRPPGTSGSLNYRGNEVDPLTPGLLHYDALPGEAPGAATSRRRGQPTPAVRGASLPQGGTPATGVGFSPPLPQVAMMPIDVCGEVVDTRSNKGFIRVVFADNRRPPVGTALEVYHQYVLGTEFAGTLVIRDYEGHHAIAVPRAWDEVKVTRGDHVECVMQVPVAETPAMPAPPVVPPVQTAQQEPTPAQPPMAVAQPTTKVVAKPAAPPAPIAAMKAAPVIRQASIAKARPAKVVAKLAVPAAPAQRDEAEATDPGTADRSTLLDSFDASEAIARATSGVERIFTLSTAKAAEQSTAATKGTATSAISKAAPGARPARLAATKAAPPAAPQRSTAPIVKPGDVTRVARPAVTKPATKSAAVTPSPSAARSSVSSALSQMLRLPTEQAAPQVRPASSVVPASATLPASSTSGTERLPPVVSPSEARLTR
jgi:hypothetical protein